MAKRKKAKPKSKPKRRTTPMATKRRKKRSTAVRRTSLSSKPATRRRKKRGLGDSVKGIVPAGKRAGAGAIGGALFAGTRLVDMPVWVRCLVGFGGAIGFGMINSPNVSAGMAGATSYYLIDKYTPVGLLHDDSMEDANYVDSDTLRDSGYMDENGNAVLCDGDGVMYQLNDNNELEAIGDIYSLNDGSNLESVSMLPLTDPYALNDGNPYNLASGY